jgi:hypothetical protein
MTGLSGQFACDPVTPVSQQLPGLHDRMFPNNRDRMWMGTGSCTMCDCPAFSASPGPGSTCINRNSAGGTCNHWDYEHR